MLRDIRHGLRALTASPGFLCVATLTLAIGIGANSAIFSVVDGVLLAPLPYRDPDALVTLVGKADGFSRLGLSEGELLSLRADSDTLADIGAYYTGAATLAGQDHPRRVRIGVATANMFQVLGVEPVIGRSFAPDEERAGGERVAILSHSAWKSHFGADSNVLDRTVNLNGKELPVVGVMPAQFRLPANLGHADPTTLWIPARLQPSTPNWSSHYWSTVARLTPGATLAAAAGELDNRHRLWQRDHSDVYERGAGFSLAVVGLHDDLVAGKGPALLLLAGAAGLVLLLACANVGNLMLTRAAARNREIALRSTLGAGRWRLVSHLLGESLVLAALGGAAGLAIATWGFELLIRVDPSAVPQLAGGGLNARVLLATFVLSLTSVVLCGLAPALRGSQADVMASLRAVGRGATGGGALARARRVLVVGEVAISVVLVVAVGLLLRSFLSLIWIDPGFDRSDVLTAQLSLSQARYPGDQEVAGFQARLLQRVRSMPGVASAATVNVAPLRGYGGDTTFRIAGRDDSSVGTDDHFLHLGYRKVSSDYFRTMGIPLLRGRAFQAIDGPDSPLVGIVNETLAGRFFADTEPIGERLRLRWSVSEQGPEIEIVGVVANSRIGSLVEQPRQELFLPAAQAQRITSIAARRTTLVIRTSVPPMSLAEPLRGVIGELDGSLPMYNVQTMAGIVADTLSERRFIMSIVTLFGTIALMLAVVGVSALVSHSVGQRTHELGVRLALGARPRDVLHLVVGEGMKLALAGVGLGLVAAVVVTRVLVSLLHAVTPTDPATFLAVAVLLVAAALLASYIPARRATRIDPMVALRHD